MARFPKKQTPAEIMRERADAKPQQRPLDFPAAATPATNPGKATPAKPLESTPTSPSEPQRPCQVCGGLSTWSDAYGVTRCESCQPPITEALVRRRISASPVTSIAPPDKQKTESEISVLPADLEICFGPLLDWGELGFWREYFRWHCPVYFMAAEITKQSVSDFCEGERFFSRTTGRETHDRQIRDCPAS
jgi:hypothetical protein